MEKLLVKAYYSSLPLSIRVIAFF